jgi:hypothetical protein
MRWILLAYLAEKIEIIKVIGGTGKISESLVGQRNKK